MKIGIVAIYIVLGFILLDVIREKAGNTTDPLAWKVIQALIVVPLWPLLLFLRIVYTLFRSF